MKRESRFKAMMEAKAQAGEEQPKDTGKGVKRFKNPDYLQTTVYIRKDTHKALKIAMAEDEIAFTDLIEKLIEDWLQARKS